MCSSLSVCLVLERKERKKGQENEKEKERPKRDRWTGTERTSDEGDQTEKKMDDRRRKTREGKREVVCSEQVMLQEKKPVASSFRDS